MHTCTVQQNPHTYKQNTTHKSYTQHAYTAQKSLVSSSYICNTVQQTSTGMYHSGTQVCAGLVNCRRSLMLGNLKSKILKDLKTANCKQ